MNKGVSIKYGDVAPEAKENFESQVKLGEITDFSDLKILKQYNAEFRNFANPCELYQTVLDGSSEAFPENPENETLGIWSKEISDEFGDFIMPLIIELEADAQYSSQGLTFTFDTQNNIYPREIGIRWLRVTDEGIDELAEEYFEPDNAFYFCHYKVENYNKVIVYFLNLNMPHNRLKLRAIDFGYGTYFTGRELRNVRVDQRINPISSEITINTVDFTLDSKSNIEYSFQKKQPLTVYFNGNMILTTFVKKSSRKSKMLWSVQSEDYIGSLDDIRFPGGIYVNKNACEIIEEISALTNIPFEIEDTFRNSTVSGYIPYTSCREALMQVCFAIKAVVNTFGSSTVKILSLSQDVSQKIPDERIYQGQSSEETETITSVSLVEHQYTESTENAEIYKAESGVSDVEILITFSEPLHSLSITNGEILKDENGNKKCGANYAYIRVQEGCVLNGKKYKHTEIRHTKNNPVVAVSDVPKDVEINNATLVSSQNADTLLEYIYDWLSKTESVRAKIVDGMKEKKINVAVYGNAIYGTVKYGSQGETTYKYDTPANVGDIITVNRDYARDNSNTFTGRIISASYNLNGNIIAKDVTIK